MKKTYSVILAERDAAYARYFPKLNKRRRNVLKMVSENAGFDVSGKRANELPHGVNGYRDVVRLMSNRTLEMALEEFNGGSDMALFLGSVNRFYSDEEMLTRFILSYGDTLRTVLPAGIVLGLWIDPNSIRLNVRNIFRAAKSAHREFFRYEDTSVMKGETRDQFEAIVVVLAKNFHGMRHGEEPRMPSKLATLLMEHPERAYDILSYQDERNVPLDKINVKALIEYLDAPAVSLSSGVL